MFRRLAQAVGLTHVGGVATAKLLKRLEECHIPGDKKAILDILEVLDEKMEMECKKTGAELVENKATPLLFKLMQEMRTDGNVASICASITARFEKIPELMLAFVELGGLHLLDEMVMIHMNNAFLSAVLPDLIASAREVGIKQAVVEIRNESANLEFCTHCQEIAQRMKDKQMGVNATTRAHSNHNNFVATVVPKGCERINKVRYPRGPCLVYLPPHPPFYPFPMSHTFSLSNQGHVLYARVPHRRDGANCGVGCGYCVCPQQGRERIHRRHRGDRGRR